MSMGYRLTPEHCFIPITFDTDLRSVVMAGYSSTSFSMDMRSPATFSNVDAFTYLFSSFDGMCGTGMVPVDVNFGAAMNARKTG